MADITDDLIRRFRPYADDFSDFDETTQKLWENLQQLLIEKGGSIKDLKRWVKDAIGTFTKLSPNGKEYSLPLALYIGEIYSRQHDPYTDYVMQRIEEERLEIIRGTLAEWLEYVIYINERRNSNLLFRFVDNYMGFTDWSFKKIFGMHSMGFALLPIRPFYLYARRSGDGKNGCHRQRSIKKRFFVSCPNDSCTFR